MAAGHDPAGCGPRSGVRIQRAGDQKAGLFSGYRGPVNFPNFHRQPDHGQRADMFGAWIAGRGPASLTGIKRGFKGQ